MGANGENVVAFLGPKASYTHQATLTRFPEPQYTVVPQTSIEDIFAAVQAGTAAYGVVPFENSSNGSVVFTLDLFADPRARFPDILVGGEIYLPVHHCLLGRLGKEEPSGAIRPHHQPLRKLPGEESEAHEASGQTTPTPTASLPPRPADPRVQPLHDLSHLTKLYSHPQAWGQCQRFLSTHLKGLERQDVSSTSKAAELVAQDSTGRSAAISSRLAAEMNEGLEVLAEGIEDEEGNCTRFFVLRRRRGCGEEEGEGEEGGKMEGFKTLVRFTVEHGEAGALADCLAVFKKFGLNMTSINTRPSGEGAWHYIFFVEFMGRKGRTDGEQGAVDEAMRELGQISKGWKWLGSWANALE